MGPKAGAAQFKINKTYEFIRFILSTTLSYNSKTIGILDRQSYTTENELPIKDIMVHPP